MPPAGVTSCTEPGWTVTPGGAVMSAEPRPCVRVSLRRRMPTSATPPDDVLATVVVAVTDGGAETNAL